MQGTCLGVLNHGFFQGILHSYLYNFSYEQYHFVTDHTSQDFLSFEISSHLSWIGSSICPLHATLSLPAFMIAEAGGDKYLAGESAQPGSFG